MHLLSVAIDIVDDDADDDDEGDGEEHTGAAQELPAQNDAEDDGDGMEMDGFPNDGRIDDVVIDLCQDDVEGERLPHE